MSNTARRYGSRTFVMGTIVMALLLTAIAASPREAQAEGWSNYCNNRKLAGQSLPGAVDWLCQGAAREMVSTMGEGDQHSVCVWGDANWIQMCTSGPNAWVYNPGNSQWAWAQPYISNNAYSWNIVHAVTWTR